MRLNTRKHSMRSRASAKKRKKLVRAKTITPPHEDKRNSFSVFTTNKTNEIGGFSLALYFLCLGLRGSVMKAILGL